MLKAAVLPNTALIPYSLDFDELPYFMDMLAGIESLLRYAPPTGHIRKAKLYDGMTHKRNASRTRHIWKAYVLLHVFQLVISHSAYPEPLAVPNFGKTSSICRSFPSIDELFIQNTVFPFFMLLRISYL